MVYNLSMDGDSIPNFIVRNILALLILSFLIPFIAPGCGGARTVKRYKVDIHVPNPPPGNRPRRVRLVLKAIDALQEPNLSRTKEYILSEKTPLVTVLLKSTAERMRAFGIEPMEEREAVQSSGHLTVILTRLETQLQKQTWLASTSIRAELYDRSGRLSRTWETTGRGAYQDSRLFAGGAGIAMGNAISRALNKLPWNEISSGH